MEDLPPSRDEATERPADAVRPEGSPARAGRARRAVLGEIEATKQYPYEYLCFRITGYRPDGWSALVLEGGDVQHDLRLFVEDLSATVRQAVEQVREPVLTVDGGEPAVQRVDPDGHALAAAGAGGSPVRHRRADQGGFPRVEPGTVRRDASRPGRAGFTISAIDRRGAGRDRPPRPSHGAVSSGASRPGRDRAEDRTQDGTLHGNDSTDLEGL